MGDVSADLQKRAKDAASRGFQAATAIASDVIEDVRDQAGQEGLNSASLGAVAQDLGGRVRKVAENAATTAFELATDKAPDAA